MERQYITTVEKVLEPGEKTTISSTPFTQSFKLDFVVIPDDITINRETDEIRLLFHHEQIVTNGKCPANFIFNQYAASTQRLAFYHKSLYEPGESMVVGTFENVSEQALRVIIAIVGYIEVSPKKPS